MKIAFVSRESVDDRRAWSGTVFHMRRALQSAGAEVETIAPLKNNHALLRRISSKVLFRVAKKHYFWEREPVVMNGYARQVNKALAKSNADWIVSPSSLIVAGVDDPRPKAFWTDATFDGMLDRYVRKSDVLARSLRQGLQAEQRALDQATVAVYCSEWAAESAASCYRVDATKVEVIPFGANFDEPVSTEEVRALVDAKPSRSVRLLFVGVDWVRKRAGFAVAVTEALVRAGCDATLDLVGCLPPAGEQVPSYVRLHGFVSKNTEEGRRKLQQLYREAHFFILPSIAEAYGIVLVEALSHGLPVVCSGVGGMGTVVREGVSGRLFPVEAPARDYAGFLAGLVGAPANYRALATSARQLFERELNWPVAGRRFLSALAARQSRLLASGFQS